MSSRATPPARRRVHPRLCYLLRVLGLFGSERQGQRCRNSFDSQHLSPGRAAPSRPSPGPELCGQHALAAQRMLPAER